MYIYRYTKLTVSFWMEETLNAIIRKINLLVFGSNRGVLWPIVVRLPSIRTQLELQTRARLLVRK